MVKAAIKTPEGDAPNPIDRHVGRRVAERRQMLRYSQAQLAQAAGVTFQQIQKYERGANRIAASRLWEMADFLNVDLNYFFEGLGETDGVVRDARKAVTRLTMEIARLAPELSPRNQKLVLDLVRQLAEVPVEADADVEA
ncbi:helix-turn-helix domain-containing protein [Brevundimonas sp. SL130]|uniref:helix-turn-helix domain-containing protein n=1 Tax=Brevundimonas sp. SL130 TaxID=2995143 RepID=UPI00226D1D08|nr:helix-turn-helix transcriptional regulator [Brevundimonas sp. SL130]WAC59624.1 helix-turn-helix transcriptional regulator [Brevundimonas sp. SL130]